MLVVMTFAVDKHFGLVGVDQEILEWNTKVGTQGDVSRAIISIAHGIYVASVHKYEDTSVTFVRSSFVYSIAAIADCHLTLKHSIICCYV
jgi:hypothetical protein